MYDPYTSLENDWEFTEGVISAVFAYGPERSTDGLPSPPETCKVRPGNPTDSQIAIAASTFGYKTTDMIFTIWDSTLEDCVPEENDRITAEDILWIIKSVKKTTYGTQYLVYCRRSALTVT